MSRTVKTMITEEYRRRYADVASACVVSLSGMNIQEQEALRGALREKSARVEVVKRRLVRRVFQGGPLDPLGRAMEGPCALVTTGDSLIDAAKVLVEAAKEFSELKLKEAIVDGDPQLLTVEQVARLKSRWELLGEIAGLVGSPGRAVAGCLTSPASRVTGCIKALAEKAA
ncbi:MAG: 50S ribosomal protein L10 [Phycisphaerae bacterium]